MEKAALIFIGLLLFSTCKINFTQILSKSCNTDSDCTNIACPSITKLKCVKNTCQCVKDGNIDLPLQTRCDPAACAALCKSKGEEVGFYVCALDHCYCRKPPM
ncbi:hypothetical protein Bca4012_061207 [Brassica carinata]